MQREGRSGGGERVGPEPKDVADLTSRRVFEFRSVNNSQFFKVVELIFICTLKFSEIEIDFA